MAVAVKLWLSRIVGPELAQGLGLVVAQDTAAPLLLIEAPLAYAIKLRWPWGVPKCSRGSMKLNSEFRIRTVQATKGQLTATKADYMDMSMES